MQIEPETLAAWRAEAVVHTLIDVREPWETELCRIDGSLDLPMGEIQESLDRVPNDRPVVVLCHHGMRSMQVVGWLRGQGWDKATNLRGGIELWASRIDPGMRRY
ncbi:MAG: sulfurtransferase [Telmatospirillum sp.]|nr:sulfurtransferase [Telmatospirillum sp.]